jgi:hypothetical protein
MTTLDQPRPISISATWAGRILSGAVILFLLVDGGMKLVPINAVIDASREFHIPVELARTLGIITLACTILYAIPATSVLGAILLTAYMGGAVYTHLRIGSPLFSHTLFGVYLGVMSWGGLWLRDAAVRALIPLRR